MAKNTPSYEYRQKCTDLVQIWYCHIWRSQIKITQLTRDPLCRRNRRRREPLCTQNNHNPQDNCGADKQNKHKNCRENFRSAMLDVICMLLFMCQISTVMKYYNQTNLLWKLDLISPLPPNFMASITPSDKEVHPETWEFYMLFALWNKKIIFLLIIQSTANLDNVNIIAA